MWYDTTSLNLCNGTSVLSLFVCLLGANTCFSFYHFIAVQYLQFIEFGIFWCRRFSAITLHPNTCHSAVLTQGEDQTQDNCQRNLKHVY